MFTCWDQSKRPIISLSPFTLSNHPRHLGEFNCILIIQATPLLPFRVLPSDGQLQTIRP